MNEVEKAKSEGKYRLAGQLARIRGERTPIYGCHYGMRSDRSYAVAEYCVGYDEVDIALSYGIVTR